MPVDAVGLLDRVERRLVLGEDRAAVGDPRFADQEIEIVPERFGELGLGVEQVHDPQVRRQAGDMRVVHGTRHAAARPQRPQALEAAAKIRRGRADRLRSHGRMARCAGLAAPLRAGRCSRRCLHWRDRTGGGRPLKQGSDVETLGLRRASHAGGDQRRGAKRLAGGKSGHVVFPKSSEYAPPLHHHKSGTPVPGSPPMGRK